MTLICDQEQELAEVSLDTTLSSLVFCKVTAKQSPQATLHQWLVAIFAKVSVKLLSNVSEVLDNVQKMEESLLRLRRVCLHTPIYSRSLERKKVQAFCLLQIAIGRRF